MKTQIHTTEFQLMLDVMSKTREIYFYGETSNYNVHSSLMLINYLVNQNSKPITLRINSPGGSVDSGLALYDAVKRSKVKIHTQCDGMAASMAAILLGSGMKGYRKAQKNSRIMIHQPSSGFIGKASDIEVHAKETARIKALLSKIISDDTKQPLKRVMKDLELDYWMTAEEALKYGIIDEVL